MPPTSAISWIASQSLVKIDISRFPRLAVEMFRQLVIFDFIQSEWSKLCHIFWAYRVSSYILFLLIMQSVSRNFRSCFVIQKWWLIQNN